MWGLNDVVVGIFVVDLDVQVLDILKEEVRLEGQLRRFQQLLVVQIRVNRDAELYGRRSIGKAEYLGEGVLVLLVVFDALAYLVWDDSKVLIKTGWLFEARIEEEKELVFVVTGKNTLYEIPEQHSSPTLVHK